MHLVPSKSEYYFYFLCLSITRTWNLLRTKEEFLKDSLGTNEKYSKKFFILCNSTCLPAWGAIHQNLSGPFIWILFDSESQNKYTDYRRHLERPSYHYRGVIYKMLSSYFLNKEAYQMLMLPISNFLNISLLKEDPK